MRQIANIEFTEIESIPSVIKDFIRGDIGSEYQFSKTNFERVIAKKEASFTSSQREILSKVLCSQMGQLPLSEKQTENIDLLKSGKTFCVTTGHQLNLFSGPVFFIYKILQTIKTAEYLKAEFPTKNFVPIFWMATEDHDFEEINHFRTQSHFYHMHAEDGKPVGRIKVEDLEFIKQFEHEFENSVFGTEMIRWIKDCYQTRSTLTEATRRLVNHLFSEYGLLILDGDEPTLKHQMKSVLRDELLNKSLIRSTKNRIVMMKEKYGKVQVNPREINLFYIQNNRERIDASGDGFRLAESGDEISSQEMIKLLESHPEYFSPNALMRPVYQEMILPNIAYIGGNAEVAYWLELVEYFKEINLPFPVIIPRNSMLFLSRKVLAKIEKSGRYLEDFFCHFPKMIHRELLKNSSVLPVIEEQEQNLKTAFAEIKKAAVETDKTFENLVNAEEQRQLKSFLRMKKRLLRAEKIKQKEKIDYLERLFLDVFPGKNWQERVYHFSVFYGDEGRLWLQKCYEAIQPEKTQLIVMEF